jgi:hypothetical protein
MMERWRSIVCCQEYEALMMSSPGLHRAMDEPAKLVLELVVTGLARTKKLIRKNVTTFVSFNNINIFFDFVS